MTDADVTTARQTDCLDPDRARAMQATLGQSPTLATGDALPAFFHQLYFWTALPPGNLGRDGHPARGQGVVPDLGLPRRMWAGGRLRFRRPLILGAPAICQTTLLSATRKTGRTGPLGLVTLELSYMQDGAECLTEERDLIYRPDPNPAAPTPPPPQAPRGADSVRELSFDTTTLFRYSALTFNGHRIHYDTDYAKTVEGYDGLVVHGPLLAQYLIALAEEDLGPLAAFRFRATAPLLHFEAARACRSGTSLWIEGPDGRQCMIAEAKPGATG